MEKHQARSALLRRQLWGGEELERDDGCNVSPAINQQSPTGQQPTRLPTHSLKQGVGSSTQGPRPRTTLPSISDGISFHQPALTATDYHTKPRGAQGREGNQHQAQAEADGPGCCQGLLLPSSQVRPEGAGSSLYARLLGFAFQLCTGQLCDLGQPTEHLQVPQW